MIYVCADDYGLSAPSSERILNCAKNGALNKISVFVNFEKIDVKRLKSESGAELSLHLNLVEGKAVCGSKLSLLTDADGRFRHTFFGLLMLSVFRGKELENQAYEEIKAQLGLWRTMAGDEPLMLDTHQHTHMIPGVLRALLRAVSDTGSKVKYLRLPSEPVLPYVMEPGLYLTYRTVNMIKQWLLKLLGISAKRKIRNASIPTAEFFGILFSGKMDEKRVSTILPHYIRKAAKTGSDVEVLFHPGYLDKKELSDGVCNKDFEKFYFSSGRKTEFDAVMNMKI